MKWGILSALGLAFVCAAPSGICGERPIVAVFPIEAKGIKFSKGLLDRLTDYLGTSLAEVGGYQVIPSEDLRNRLFQEKKKSYKLKCDKKCQIDLARELAAQKTVSTKILKLGSKCTVAVRLYDLMRAATEGAAKVHGNCNEDGIVASLDKAVEKLTGASDGAAAEAAKKKPEEERLTIEAEQVVDRKHVKQYWGDGKPRPLLSYDKFRRESKIKVQKEDKRKAIREQLEALRKYEKDPKEKPALLFRLAENYFEESVALQRIGRRKDASVWQNKAIDMYNQIVDEFPRYHDRDVIYFFLAGSLWDLQRYKEALKVYRRLIKEYPNSKYIPDAYLGFGEYYFENTKLEKALMGYKKVAEYKEAEIYPYALYKQGWCYYNLHEWEKAKDMFKSVVRIHENEGILVSDKLNELKMEAQMVLEIMEKRK